MDVNTPLGGEDPIAAFPVLTFDTLLTAVAATSTGDYTVVFLGTNKGHLKKVKYLGHLNYQTIPTDRARSKRFEKNKKKKNKENRRINHVQSNLIDRVLISTTV